MNTSGKVSFKSVLHISKQFFKRSHNVECTQCRAITTILTLLVHGLLFEHHEFHRNFLHNV